MGCIQFISKGRNKEDVFYPWGHLLIISDELLCHVIYNTKRYLHSPYVLKSISL